MKTNKILMAVALAAGFTACTSEDIVENNNVNLEARKALPSMTLTLGESVDSRFAWDLEELAWNKFTAEDKFGAGLMDTELFTTLGAAPLTNYIFSTEDGKSYSTTSQMVEGTYFFYSYDGFEKSASRKAIEFDLTNQKSLDLTKPGEAINANQLFISPLYKLEAANANEALPVNFYSYWASAEVKIKNTSGEPFKLVRIMLESASKDANGAYDQLFELKGTLTPASLGTVAVKNSSIANLVYYYDAAEGKYVLPYKNASDKTKGRVAITDILTKDIAAATKAEATMMLDCGKYELADDEEVTAYFLVPAGNYKDINVKFFVELESEDEDEEPAVLELEAVDAVLNVKSSTDATENDRTSFQRGKTTALFGRNAEGVAIAHEIDDIDIVSAEESGKYATSYEDLAAILKEAGSDVAIENMGDLVINEKVVKLMQKYDDISTIEFKNPVEIIGGAKKLTLPKNLKVASATITAGKFVAEGNLGGDVTVNPGAELTVGYVQNGTISNMSTVNVITTAKVTIKNVAKDAAGNALTTNVAIQAAGAKVMNVSTADDAVNSTVNLIGNPKNLYLNAELDEDGEVVTGMEITATGLTIAYGQNLYIAEDVKLNAAADYTKFVNGGYVKNEGTIAYVKNQATYSSSTFRVAEIENYGIIENLQNLAYSTADEFAEEAKAIVEMKDRNANIKAYSTPGSGTFVEGWIDNTIGAFVTGGQVYASYTDTEAKTGILGNVQSIDRLIVKNCTWTDPKFPSTVTFVELSAVTLEATLEDDGSVADAEVVTSWGTVSISGSSVVKYSVAMNGTIENTEFKKDLTTSADKLTDVKVAGKLVSTAAAIQLIGVTMNDGAFDATEINVTDLETGTSTITHTAKTTTINGDVTLESVGSSDVEINVGHDAKFIVENGAVLGTSGYENKVTVNALPAGTHTGSKAGKILNYGTIYGAVVE